MCVNICVYQMVSFRVHYLFSAQWVVGLHFLRFLQGTSVLLPTLPSNISLDKVLGMSCCERCGRAVSFFWMTSLSFHISLIFQSLHIWRRCSRNSEWSLDLLVADGFWRSRLCKIIETFNALLLHF